MSDYVKVFDVRVESARAYRAFTDPAELEQWFTTKFDADQEHGGGVAESPGGKVGFEVVDVKPDELLRYRQWAGSPDTGVEVTVTFEDVDTGTRITVTHAGFGGDSILGQPNVHRGMDEAYADLVLYLEHGIGVARHRDMASDCDFGANLVDTTAGAVVQSVDADAFAASAGLVAGDLLVQLDTAPVFRSSDMDLFVRLHRSGDEASVAFVRDAVLHRATGRFSRRDDRRFEHVA